MTQQEFQQRYTYNAATDKLGEGGFGSVFKAYDNHLDRWVALKIAKVNPQYENIRLKKEVEMVAKLPTHQNIARYEECYTFSSFDGEYDFGILRYYEEGNLLQLLRRGAINPVSTEQKNAILTQILEGIDFLHQNGIIHRDLKPQNILIVRRDNKFIPKITDFGISKQLNIHNHSVFSNSLAGTGTLSYASPEQLSDSEIRKNTDLWSCGVIAFQVFTGNLPFTTGEHTSTSEAGRIELFRQINSGKLPKEIDTIPASWQTLIRRCLITDAEKRIKNIQEAKAILTVSSDETRPVSTETDLIDDKTRIDTPSEFLSATQTYSIEMIYVQGGSFMMGCTSEQGNDCWDSEKPVHQVTVNDFYIGKYEVTQAQWRAVMGHNPSCFEGENLPVEQVNWDDVQEFIRKLNMQTGKNYRLPTEAEWEYACRGGIHSAHYKYSGSNTVDHVAWYYENAGDKSLDDKTWDFDKFFSNNNKTHPVGTKSPNELGIYDMSGNVWEWCRDLSESGTVIRGGSWCNAATSCRVAYRDYNSPGLCGSNLGFRLVLS